MATKKLTKAELQAQEEKEAQVKAKLEATQRRIAKQVRYQEHKSSFGTRNDAAARRRADTCERFGYRTARHNPGLEEYNDQEEPAPTS